MVQNTDVCTVVESLSKLLALVELPAPEELAEFLVDFLAESHHPQLAPQPVPAQTQEFRELPADFLAESHHQKLSCHLGAQDFSSCHTGAKMSTMIIFKIPFTLPFWRCKLLVCHFETDHLETVIKKVNKPFLAAILAQKCLQ